MQGNSLVKRLKALAAFRVLYATLLLGTFFVFQIGLSIFPYPYAVLYLIVVLYALSIVYAVLLERVRARPFAHVQINLDVITIIVLIFITGGIESWFSWLLHLSVIAAAMVIGKRTGYYVATLSSILYGLLIDLQYYRILPIPIPYDTNLLEKDFLYRIFLNIAGLYLMAYLMGELVSRLESKDRDIKDLTVFNREVIENTPSGLITTDMRRKIKIFNKAAEQITGIPRERAIGRNVADLMPFLSRLPLDNRLEDIVDLDGEKKVIGMNFSIMRDASGREIGYICIFQDLTELKRLGDEVKNKEKLATIGELSAKIAHEIRNPLASLKSSMEMLLETDTDGPARERLIGIAIKEMDRLNLILSDVLDFSRPSAITVTEFDLNATLAEIIELLKKRGATGVTFGREFDGPFQIKGDSEKLRQVFWNLGINALEAMEQQGGGELSISTSAENGTITITFADTGPGIDLQETGKIFFPFYTSKRSGGGLGLSIAMRIVEDHDGTLSVKSEKGEGARFTIMLPDRREKHDE
jgi:two-component system sensor histidine kinase PilS (NtrC family)